MAGIWIGERGVDTNPKADGPERQRYIESYELQPIDAQTNGPQLLYGLRYRSQNAPKSGDRHRILRHSPQ